MLTHLGALQGTACQRLAICVTPNSSEVLLHSSVVVHTCNGDFESGTSYTLQMIMHRRYHHFLSFTRSGCGATTIPGGWRGGGKPLRRCPVQAMLNDVDSVDSTSSIIHGETEDHDKGGRMLSLFEALGSFSQRCLARVISVKSISSYRTGHRATAERGLLSFPEGGAQGLNSLHQQEQQP
jgi:hypothetical protein